MLTFLFGILLGKKSMMLLLGNIILVTIINKNFNFLRKFLNSLSFFLLIKKNIISIKLLF